MKAAIIHEFGQPPRYGEHPAPASTAAAESVEVVAAALKNIDRGLVSGQHYASSSLTLPSVAGVDGVVRLPDGTLAYSGAVAPHGLMAERTLVRPEQAVPLPPGLDPALAAAVPNAGLSAWYALEFAGQVQAGQHVLIVGATGVTGTVAAHLAKQVFRAGRVTVVGRNATRLASLTDTDADRALAADEALAENIAAEHHSSPIDLVIDFLWGAPAQAVLHALGGSSLHRTFHRTRYVEVGAMAGPTIELAAGTLRSAGLEIVGSGGGSVSTAAQARIPEILPQLFELAGAGALGIDIQTYPLSAVADVWNAPQPSGTRAVFLPSR